MFPQPQQHLVGMSKTVDFVQNQLSGLLCGTDVVEGLEHRLKLLMRRWIRHIHDDKQQLTLHGFFKRRAE